MLDAADVCHALLPYFRMASINVCLKYIRSIKYDLGRVAPIADTFLPAKSYLVVEKKCQNYYIPRPIKARNILGQYSHIAWRLPIQVYVSIL